MIESHWTAAGQPDGWTRLELGHREAADVRRYQAQLRAPPIRLVAISFQPRAVCRYRPR